MDKAESKPAAKSGAGLEGVVAAESAIGDVDGVNGVLIYQGLDIHDLAEHSNFEETVFLLWHGRLPKREELEALRAELSANQRLPGEVLEMMRSFPREGALRTATRLTAQLPVVVATFERLRNGKEPVEPKPGLGIAANFLYMLTGEE